MNINQVVGKRDEGLKKGETMKEEGKWFRWPVSLYFLLGLTYQGTAVAAEGMSEYKLKDIIVAATDAICYMTAKGTVLS